VAEATGTGEAAPIDWRMSAALEDVRRGDVAMPEVTNLEAAVRAWQALAPEDQAEAVLTPEHPLRIDAGEAVARFAGDAIGGLARHLPTTSD